MAGGRPTEYSIALIDDLCERISSSSKSLSTICKEIGISRGTVYKWLNESDKQEFINKYARAKEEQADFLAEEILEIADDNSGDVTYNKDGDEVINTEFVQRSKLRMEARKWIASKLKPKKYSDRTNIDHTTNGEKITQPIDLSKLSAQALKELDEAADES